MWYFLALVAVVLVGIIVYGRRKEIVDDRLGNHETTLKLLCDQQDKIWRHLLADDAKSTGRTNAVDESLSILYGRLHDAESRIATLEAEIARLRAAGTEPQPTPESTPAPEPAPAAEVLPIAEAITPAPVEPTSEPPSEPIAEPEPMPDAVVAQEPLAAAPAARTAVPAQLPVPRVLAPARDLSPAPTATFTDRARSIEEGLTTRLAVWLGAIALALAGAFLVKYTVDHELITPLWRVILAGVFGAVMLGLGEKLRAGYDRISQGLSGAGIAVWFAAILAATNLYFLIANEVGFVLLALVTAFAVALSLRQGPLIALLGLLGGFMTPYWIGSTEPQPAPLFGYLFLLQLGLLSVTRHRQWWPIAALTLIGGMIWSSIWLATQHGHAPSPFLGLFLISSLALWVSMLHHRPPPTASADDAHSTAAHIPTASEARIETALTWFGTTAGLLLVALMVSIGEYRPIDWGFLGLLSAGAIVLARLDARYESLAPLTAVTAGIVLAAWRLGATAPIDPAAYGAVAIGMGGVFAVGGFLAMWKSRVPWTFAALSATSTVGFLMVAFFALRDPAIPGPWGSIALGLASLLAAFAMPAQIARVRDNARTAATQTGPHEPAKSAREVVDVFAIGATVLLASTIAFEWRQYWISVGWALLVVPVAAAVWRLKLDWLRGCVWLLGGLVGARLLLNPYILFDYPVEPHPVFNWMMLVYPLATLGFIGGTIFVRKAHDERLGNALEFVAVKFLWVLITLDVHLCFHPHALDSWSVDFTEWGMLTDAWLLYAMALLVIGRRFPRHSLNVSGAGIAMCALAVSVLAPVTLDNPMVTGFAAPHVPMPLDLLLAFGVSGALCAAVGWELSRRDQRHLRRLSPWLESGAVLLVAMLVVGEVRTLFHGADLATWRVPLAEWGSISMGLLAFAGALAAVDFRWPRKSLGNGATAVILAASALFIFGQIAIGNPLWQSKNRWLWANPVPEMLLGYLLPAMMLAGIAPIVRERARAANGAKWAAWRARTATLAEFLTVAAVWLLVSQLVRHAFHPGTLHGKNVLTEWGILAGSWLLIAFGFRHLGEMWHRPVFDMGARIVAIAAVAFACFVPGGLAIPLREGFASGELPIALDLLLAFALPAALAMALAAVWRVSDARANASFTGSNGGANGGANAHDDASVSDGLDIAAFWLIILCVILQVRAIYHAPHLDEFGVDVREWSVAAVVFMLLGFAFASVGRHFDLMHWRGAGNALMLGGLGATLLGPGLVANPIWHPVAVGEWPIANDLLLIYGLPALGGMAIAHHYWRQGAVVRSRISGVMALLLAFIAVNLEVRQGFQGSMLDAPDTLTAEFYAYSAAWMIFGMVLLVLGILTRGIVLRLASLVVMTLAVGKVFLVDVSALPDLLRVLSLGGLGAALLILAFIYQRFVFRLPTATPPAAPTSELPK